MTWSKVSDDLHGHPKALRAGLEAMGLWVLAMSYAADYLLDGRVPKHVLGRLAGSVADGERLASRLVDAGLWEQVGPEEWAFHDWHVYQPSREAVLTEKQRKAEAGRKGGQAKALARAKQALSGSLPTAMPSGSASAVPPSPSPSPSPNPEGRARERADSPEGSETEPMTTTPSPRPIPLDPMGDADLGAAWAEAVTEGSGTKMSPPYGGELRALVQAAQTHGPARTGLHGSTALVTWARERGRAYGAAYRGQRRTVFGFRDWLNAPDAPMPGVRSAPRAEPASPPYHEKYVPPPKLRPEELGKPPEWKPQVPLEMRRTANGGGE